MPDTIDAHGDPLGFRFKKGTSPSALRAGYGRDVITVEARGLANHQKEAVVTDGADGSAWRLSSDEGVQINGTDLAPFPLGFVNAGMQSDLYGRLRALATARSIPLRDVKVRLVNHYWLTGSFVQGTGEGHVEPPDLDIAIESPASSMAVEALTAAAIDASPAFAFLRAPLSANTFALYINGRRRPVEGVPNSSAADATDPYRFCAQAPRPCTDAPAYPLITKTDRRESNVAPPSAATAGGKPLRHVVGDGAQIGRHGLYGVETYLNVPGATHFRLVGDEGARDEAPSGLALLSAGIAFCYMRQLSRYIETMKMAILGVRLVQFNPYIAGEVAGVEPIDTHLFLNGEASEQTHLQLLTVAARSCYLHASARTPLDPIVRVVHNGRALARAA